MNLPKKSISSDIKIEPLGSGGHFDIQPPANPVNESSEVFQEGDWWTFFGAAFIIFSIFTLLGLYFNVGHFIEDSAPVAKAGYDRLTQAAESLVGQDYDRAQRWFQGAEDAFLEVEKSTRFLQYQAQGYLQSDLYLDTARNLLESGVIMANLGQQFSELLEESRHLPHDFITENKRGSSTPLLTNQIHDLKKRLDQIQSDSFQLYQSINNINLKTLPENLADSAEKAKGYLADFIGVLHLMNQHFEAALIMLGDEVPHRYLLLFQNNHELRATGGFIGSYALIDVNDAVITKMEVKDVYETDGQLMAVVPAPPGIDQVAPQLYMRDANYSPDFPTSAKKIMWFLDQSRGPSVDTVIAIDQTVAEALLNLTGPIQLEHFPLEINADNFNDLMSFHVESKLSETSTPKQLLFDLIPVFKERLIKADQLREMADTLIDLAAKRHVQMYSNFQSVQNFAESFHLSGKMVVAQPKVDYLSVITTSIGGNKSDAFIDSYYNHQTQINEKGEVTNYLTIRKDHTWTESAFEPWRALLQRYGYKNLNEQTLRFIHGAGPNSDYLRIYVPKGSELIQLQGAYAENIVVEEELNYTVYALQMKISAGNRKEIQLAYKLPFKIKPGDFYKFIAQKQAGTENIILRKSLETTEGLTVAKSSPAIEPGAFDLSAGYEINFDHNQSFVAAIEKLKN